jgi:hypothetical protein
MSLVVCWLDGCDDAAIEIPAQGPFECFVTTFTYTWLASVKAFGAGVVWPLTVSDYIQRSQTGFLLAENDEAEKNYV